jgi:small subunit ribosomal protein S16
MLPREHADRIKLDAERAKYWLGVGARPSERVTRFLAGLELVKASERREQPKKSAPKAKAQERAKAAAEASGEAAA